MTFVKAFRLTLLVGVALVDHLQGACPITYFAEPIQYEVAAETDFYYTGINLKTVTSCAKFCSQREFCRSAIYNQRTKTCGISYDHTVSCSSKMDRFENFEEKGSTSDLVRIACVDKCRDTLGVQNDDPNNHLSGNPASVFKPIGIITGDPHDGRQKKFLSRSPTMRKIAIVTDETADFVKAEGRPRAEGYVTKLVLTNVSGLSENGVPSVEPLTLSSQDSSTGEYPKKGKSQICYRTIKNRYLLGASFENHDVDSINECRCLCAATHRANGLHKCRSFQYRAKDCVLNKGNHLGRFDLIDQRKSVYQYIDCDTEILLEVANNVCPNFKSATIMATTTTPTSATSLETKPTSITKEMTTSTTPKSTKKTGEEVETEKEKENLKEAGNEKSHPTGELSQQLKKEEQKASAEPNPKEKETIKQEKKESEAKAQLLKKEKDQEKLVTSTKSLPETSKTAETITSTQPTTTASELPTTKVEETTATTSAPSEADTKVIVTTTTSPETTTIVSEMMPKSRNEILEKSKEGEMKIKNDGCFEVIDDHLMVSVAGGLEHDVSLEECQCHCANSKSVGKYSFQCASATYYHIERDCILNLEDRFMRSNLFEKQFVNFNVSYVGITCKLDDAVKATKELSDSSCRQPAITTTSAPKKKKTGENSDSCYVELSDFVLEGTAVAVETAVSPQECKCKCAEGEKLYGEECQSFLYYYDSNTCLINKQNRFSNPEKFNFAPSANQRRSYFEWTCASKDMERQEYMKEKCAISTTATLATEASTNTLHVEGDPVKVEKDLDDVETTSTQKTMATKTSKADDEVATKKLESTTEVPSTTTTSKTTTTEPSSSEKTKELAKPPSSDVEVGEGEVKMRPIEKKLLAKAQDNGARIKDAKETEEVSTKPLSLDELERLQNLASNPDLNKVKKSELKPVKVQKAEEGKVIETASPSPSLKKQSKVRTQIPEAEGLSDEELEESITKTLTPALEDNPTTRPTPATTTEAIPETRPKIAGVKTKKFDDKEVKPETTTEKPVPISSTIPTTTTTTIGYPPAGRCTYSALYQTAFYGRRTLKTVRVKTPADCFNACFALRCRSANLAQGQGGLNNCELFRDSLIDYRRPDMIGYEPSSVYFDGINCEGH